MEETSFLRIGNRVTSVGEEAPWGVLQEEESERRNKELAQAKSLSGSEEKDVSEYPGKINAHWKGDGKKQLEDHKIPVYFALFLQSSDIRNRWLPG